MKNAIIKFWVTLSLVSVSLFTIYHILINHKLDKDND